jgi:hypothetical protein
MRLNSKTDIALLLLAWLITACALTACKDDGDDGGNTATEAKDPNLNGKWTGRWDTSSTGGNMTMNAVDVNGAISGNLTLESSICMRTATIAGTRSGAGFQFTATAEAQGDNVDPHVVDFEGQISADNQDATGTFSYKGGVCAGENGTFSVKWSGAVTPDTGGTDQGGTDQ